MDSQRFGRVELPVAWRRTSVNCHPVDSNGRCMVSRVVTVTIQIPGPCPIASRPVPTLFDYFKSYRLPSDGTDGRTPDGTLSLSRSPKAQRLGASRTIPDSTPTSPTSRDLRIYDIIPDFWPASRLPTFPRRLRIRIGLSIVASLLCNMFRTRADSCRTPPSCIPTPYSS